LVLAVAVLGAVRAAEQPMLAVLVAVVAHPSN
jgi:hypothetical protein